MKQLITFTLVLLFLVGCSADIQNTPEEVIIENIGPYDCTDFFTTGDYSTFCTIDTEIVNILDYTFEDQGAQCKYIIPSLNNDVNTTVYFTSLATLEEAKGEYENRKTASDKAAVEDTKNFHSEIEVGNYEGYVSEEQHSNYVKSITVKYNNVLVTSVVVYFQEWFPDTAPCNYNTVELTLFMIDILEHMEK